MAGRMASHKVGTPLLESIGEPDQAWLRERLEELERIYRPSASAGERRAAEWVVDQLRALGADARIEAADAHGTYWWPLGIGTALGALGGLAALRGHRRLGAALGAIGAAGIASDFPPHQRRLRSPLPKRTTYNVVCEIGDPDAERTIVISAHHDSAHSGLVFHPAIPKIADRLGLLENVETSPALMAPVIGGPLLVALGALSNLKPLTKLGAVLAAGATAAMAEIGSRKVVPGANDNGTAVVSLLALAKRLADHPAPGIRVVLLSAGAEESFSEGMKAFGERHFAELSEGLDLLPRARVDRVPAPAGAPRRGLPEDVRLPRRRRWSCSIRPPRRWGSGCIRTCACTTGPTAWRRSRRATRRR